MKRTIDQETSTDKFEMLRNDLINNKEYFDNSESMLQVIDSLVDSDNNNILHNGLLVVCKMDTLKPFFVSKNVERILGYTQEEFISMGEKIWQKVMAIDQPDFWEHLLEWKSNFKNVVPESETIVRHKRVYCGISFLEKGGAIKRCIVYYETTYNKSGALANLSTIYFKDITHFYKSNDYWMYFQNYTEDKVYDRLYSINGMQNNIITSREMDVLKLVADGKSTKEVAKILYISPETVSQHRKNMIKRTNTKDTSGLIYICKICGLI